MDTLLSATIEEELDGLRREQPQQLSEDQRAQLIAMSDDIALVWDHPQVSTVLKKRLLRTVLEEIVVRVTEQRIAMVLHWRGSSSLRTARVCIDGRLIKF